MAAVKAVSYAGFKVLVTAQGTCYEQEVAKYILFGESSGGGIVFEVALAIPSDDATDFEDNIKAQATRTNQ